jgi:hypothetical protein
MIAGFHALEANSWRWTARNFAVTLLPPPGADRKGALLRLRLVIPDGQIEKLGPMTLSADVDDRTLNPQTFSKGGDYDYVRDVPADVLRTNLAPVIFTFDKALAPSLGDGRELAAIVTEIALLSK